MVEAMLERDNVQAGDRERFREVAENELLALDEGNYAPFQIVVSPSQALQASPQ